MNPPVPAPAARPLSTRLQLLVELHGGRPTRLRPLSQRLAVTVQAVSAFLKRLETEGLVEYREGAWRPTPQGTAELQRSLSELRRFLDEASGRLQVIDRTLALATRETRAGDEVGLVMKAGRLHATPGLSAPSRGRAQTDARPGRLVLVGELEGIVDLSPAPLTLLAHAALPTDVGLQRARRHITRARETHERLLLAAHDLSSLGWALQLGQPVDLEFSPMAAALEAARRGVPVVYLVAKTDLPHLEAEFREAQRDGLSRVPVRSVSA